MNWTALGQASQDIRHRCGCRPGDGCGERL